MKRLIYFILLGISLLFILNSCDFSSNNTSTNSTLQEPQVKVTYPQSGDVLAILEETDGVSYLEYYGELGDNQLSKIVGNINGDEFEFRPLNGGVNEFVMGKYMIRYIYTNNTSLDLQLYINKTFIYEESSITSQSSAKRALSKDEECDISRKAIGYAFITILGISETFSLYNYDEFITHVNMEKVLVEMITEFPNLKTAFENYQKECVDNDDKTEIIDKTEIVDETTVGVYANVNISGYSGGFIADDGVAFMLEDGYPGYLALTDKENSDLSDMIIMRFDTVLVAGNTYQLKNITDPSAQIVFGFSSPQLLNNDGDKITFYANSGSVTLNKFGSSFGDEITGSFSCEVSGDNGLNGHIDGTFNGTLEPASFYQ